MMVQQWHGHTSSVPGLEWSDDSAMLVSGSNDNTVKVWSVGEQEPRHTLLHQSGVKAVAWKRGMLVTGGGLQD